MRCSNADAQSWYDFVQTFGGTHNLPMLNVLRERKKFIHRQFGMQEQILSYENHDYSIYMADITHTIQILLWQSCVTLENLCLIPKRQFKVCICSNFQLIKIIKNGKRVYSNWMNSDMALTMAQHHHEPTLYLQLYSDGTTLDANQKRTITPGFLSVLNFSSEMKTMPCSIAPICLFPKYVCL